MTEKLTARPRLPLPSLGVANSQDVPPYGPSPLTTFPKERKIARYLTDDEVIEEAIGILRDRMCMPGEQMADPKTVKKFLTLNLSEEEREVFAVLWLDSQNRVIEFEKLFFGTISQTMVAPREVLKAAMRVNAAAVILCHNHPSGLTAPSAADTVITDTLARVLREVDVRVLDHIIVAGLDTYSFAEHGKI